MLLVPEILGHGERCVSHAEAAARQLVHLAEHHHHVGQHARRLHFPIQFLALATALPDAAEKTDPLMPAHHVVNHFGEENCLADARAAEQSCLATALERHEHVDRLDTRLKDLGLCSALGEGGRRLVDAVQAHLPELGPTVDGPPEHIEHPGADRFPHWDLQWTAGVLYGRAAREPLWRSHGNAADAVCIELRPDLDQNVALLAGTQ